MKYLAFYARLYENKYLKESRRFTAISHFINPEVAIFIEEALVPDNKQKASPLLCGLQQLLASSPAYQEI